MTMAEGKSNIIFISKRPPGGKPFGTKASTVNLTFSKLSDKQTTPSLVHNSQGNP